MRVDLFLGEFREDGRGRLGASRERSRLGDGGEIAIRLGHAGYAPLESFGAFGRIFSTSRAGAGMTWTEMSSPTRRAAAAPGVGRGLDGADVAADEDGDVAGADVFLADEDDVGGLDHRVGRLDGADQAPRFHHPQSIHARTLTYCCTCHNCCTIRG